MTAVRFENFGKISEVLKTTTLESPKPRKGEVLVRVAAAATNPSDAKNVVGQMHGTGLPPHVGPRFRRCRCRSTRCGIAGWQRSMG
jgi:NADPH:quinone reductase-like Zn-dependent oxidoreductase